MSNNIDIEITAVCADHAAALDIYQDLAGEFIAAERSGRPLELGDNHRPLYGARVQFEGGMDTVHIDGECRHDYCDDNADRMVMYLRARGVQEVYITVDSGWIYQYAEYTYVDNILAVRYLPSEYWPDADSVDDYEEALREALADHGQMVIIKRYAKEA